MAFFDWLRRFLNPKEERSAPPPPPLVPSAPQPPAPPPSPVPTTVPPPPASIDLNAGDFLPITREEQKEAAQQVTRWGPWFGRRDLIPPADDLRTKLIDRGLVTHGLLSPEQLVEIHRVGAEMERLRPSIAGVAAQVAKAGESAVQADREARARLKEQKKAEAARRKKEHTQAVAQRRATDIVFLGRGVSGRLGERTSDLARLKVLDLPILSTPADLAAALNLSIPKVRWLAFHTEVAARVHYINFTVPKKSGGTRTLSAPHRTLAAAQEWVLAHIVGRLPVEAPAHGFLPRRSILTNAQPHSGKALVVNLDLADFFPSITFPRVRRRLPAPGLFSRGGHDSRSAVYGMSAPAGFLRRPTLSCGRGSARSAAGSLHQSGAVQPGGAPARSPSPGFGGEAGTDLHALCRRSDLFRH